MVYGVWSERPQFSAHRIEVAYMCGAEARSLLGLLHGTLSPSLSLSLSLILSSQPLQGLQVIHAVGDLCLDAMLRVAIAPSQ